MKKRIYTVLIVIAVALIGAACTTEGDQTADSEETETESYRVTITDEEMEAGYASFQMDEYIFFDASITPTSVYEDGVNSYFLISDCVVEEEDEDGDSGEESNAGEKGGSGEDGTSDEDGDSDANAGLGEEGESDVTTGNKTVINNENTIYGYSLEEFYNLLADYSTVDFSESGTDWRPDSCVLWLSSDLALDPGDIYPIGFLGSYLPDGGGELDYATEEEQGLEILEFLKTLTGMEISGEWQCYTYSWENVQAANELMEEETGYGAYYDPFDVTSDENPIQLSSLEESEFREFYSFCFTYEVDGIPLSLYPLSVNSVSLGENETPGEYLTDFNNSYIVNYEYINLEPCWVTASEDGILYAHIYRGWSLGSVYKEAEEILPASAILETCEGYLRSEVIVDTLTVTDMSLVYDQGYTDEDKEDGVVDVVLRPYWIVTTYNNWSRTEKHFIFDARTGRLVEDDETQLY